MPLNQNPPEKQKTLSSHEEPAKAFLFSHQERNLYKVPTKPQGQDIRQKVIPNEEYRKNYNSQLVLILDDKFFKRQ